MFSCRLQDEIHSADSLHMDEPLKRNATFTDYIMLSFWIDSFKRHFKLSVDIFLMYVRHPNFKLIQEKIQVI